VAERKVLTWPAGLVETPVRRAWFDRLRKLPPGLDADAVAQRFGSNYRAVLRWAHVFGYEFRDRRRHTAPEKWSMVDWSQTDAHIARELGVSRERVRQVRLERSLPPSTRSHGPALELAAG
jgi:hypothetical protein